MIRLGLMLERSRSAECAGVQPADARRAQRVRDKAIWYLGDPFTPRRAAGSSVSR